MSLSDIDQHISSLREEERKIQDVYKKRARFLHQNAILPINDDFPDYIRYFLHEEQLKQSAGARNNEVISNLEKIMSDFIKNTTENLRSEDIFTLVGTPYRLPINGKQICEQVQGIEISQGEYSAKREVLIDLPVKAASSKVMLQLKDIISQR
ncbi:unnamed protein product [Rotaria sp. Silwood2]|nr:unnamed protein product [Rotaria sp. Silwood2]CAF2915097.1 unnamed protein product [Rotaria sp. Silwood2]CAF3383605.1 unnamed protein product [Rotaria sp. Silwood2]CAF3409600.1 unnamed protein product [Rotaria sp. Silwood2]CAF4434768.1 unnamed protein product [Rotaria sp. Silwood2]